MRSSFIEILSDKVEIPVIQRDFAQGRLDIKTSKIRRDFLDALFNFLKIKNSELLGSELELDFIYGYNEELESGQNSFIPIDGQQRLTTLWLLYWLVAAKENVKINDKSFLSNFLYETRHSTTQFCKKLLKFSPEFSGNRISNEVVNQPWYFETWDFDPSIQAMLVVLNDIEDRYNLLKIEPLWDIIGNLNCPFYFYKLDMNKVGLTDDLYIKMNSRGKALTEFEYFKAGFTDIIGEPNQKKRFEISIDGIWIDSIWNIVGKSGNQIEENDVALTVDNCFLNLFNYITSVIAYKADLRSKDGSRYQDTVVSSDLVKKIYSDQTNQILLFDVLDAIVLQDEQEPEFWSNTFYFGKDYFEPSKSRLFFTHNEVNLIKRCLFNFSGGRLFSFPEQLLLHACITELLTKTPNFGYKIRTIRNLAINSENELRDTTLGDSFNEIEQFVVNGDLSVFKNFKTDQIKEEINKNYFFNKNSINIDIVRQTEDSDIFRGSISLIPFDEKFTNRAYKFLEIFDEDVIIENFVTLSNLLLIFGDYTQDDGLVTNLMAPQKGIIRSFFTAPGYNKEQFITKTQRVLLNCLDYLIANPQTVVSLKVKNSIVDYTANSKDWRYYFLKYPSFRAGCKKGYYNWYNGNYCMWRMKEKQINGFHWDPFLYELTKSTYGGYLSLDCYGNKLLFTLESEKLQISSLPNAFLIENPLTNDNILYNHLTDNYLIGGDGKLIISQNIEGFDLEDRVEKMNHVFDVLVSNFS